MRLTITLLFLVGIVSLALAQTTGKIRWIVPGRFVIRDTQCEPVFAAGAPGLFVMKKGVLARYDAVTLKLQGVVELFGKLEDLPTEGALTLQEQTTMITARAQRLLPAAMALHGNDLLLLIGDTFFRVDAQSLDIKVNKSLTDDAQANTRIESHLFAPTPQMQIAGNIVYVISSQITPQVNVTITAIDSNDGTLLATKSLPAPLMPSAAVWQPINGGLVFNDIYPLWQRPAIQCIATADGVYVLRCGGLAKLDPRTLEPLKVTELYGPMAALAENADKNARETASLDRAQRLMPAAMLVQEKALLIISGDHFFRVNMDTLAIEKQSTLTQTAGAALAGRINQLAALGQPQLRPGKQGLIMVRGKELTVISPADGAAHPVPLPAALTKSLPFIRPREQMFKLRTPVDGKPISLNGVVWSEAKDWFMYDQQYGVFKLTGDPLAKIAVNADAQQGQIMLQGTFHKQDEGTPASWLGTVEITNTPTTFHLFSVSGLVKRHPAPDGDFWTISGMYENSDFVLVGAKAKELTAIPDLDGRQAFVAGRFTMQYAKAPVYGHGYLEVQNYSLQPSPEEQAERQELARPVISIAAGENFYAARNGVVVRFDGASLDQKGTNDLLPPLPDLPKDGDASPELLKAIIQNRALRSMTPLVIPQGNDLAVMLAGSGYFHLDGTTLETKGHLPQDQYPFQVQPGASILTDATLFAISGKNLLAINLTDGKVTNKVELPEKMQHMLYPEFMP